MRAYAAQHVYAARALSLATSALCLLLSGAPCRFYFACYCLLAFDAAMPITFTPLRYMLLADTYCHCLRWLFLCRHIFATLP